VTLIDTGPLVASQLKTDNYFRWAKQQFQSLPLPFLTCEAVLTEAAYLLQRDGVASHALSDLVIAGVIQVSFDLSSEIRAVHELLEKYQNIPMDWADACLFECQNCIETAAS